ncbi:Blue copper oxidase CueO precursor [Klebsiella pneumoniae IS53]|nr:Blue copper oxidase CueO precursor [Klebsiella pneumoniae IS53]
MGSTGRQVAMGLAGLVLIEDEESGRCCCLSSGESMMCR